MKLASECIGYSGEVGHRSCFKVFVSRYDWEDEDIGGCG